MLRQRSSTSRYLLVYPIALLTSARRADVLNSASDRPCTSYCTYDKCSRLRATASGSAGQGGSTSVCPSPAGARKARYSLARSISMGSSGRRVGFKADYEHPHFEGFASEA